MNSLTSIDFSEPSSLFFLFFFVKSLALSLSARPPPILSLSLPSCVTIESFRHPRKGSLSPRSLITPCSHIPQREAEKGHNKKAANVFMTFFSSFHFFPILSLPFSPVPWCSSDDSNNVDTSEDISYSNAGHGGLRTICLRHSFAVWAFPTPHTNTFYLSAVFALAYFHPPSLSSLLQPKTSTTVDTFTRYKHCTVTLECDTQSQEVFVCRRISAKAF